MPVSVTPTPKPTAVRHSSLLVNHVIADFISTAQTNSSGATNGGSTIKPRLDFIGLGSLTFFMGYVVVMMA